MLKDLVLRNRSCRKFYTDHLVSVEMLMSLIELARVTPSSKNRQPLKYILVTGKDETDFVFNQLSWAKHLKNWAGPEKAERPPAFLIMLLDTMLNEQALIDAGISAQTILLGATEIGLGGCIIRTVNRSAVRQYYQLPAHLDIIQVIAIGKPQQDIELTSVQEDGKTEYFEHKSIHFVPKRSLEDIIYIPHHK